MLARNGTSFFVNGQRMVPEDCTSQFVWKATNNTVTSMIYANWFTGQPDCAEVDQSFRESCLHYSSDSEFKLNDVACEWSGCAICQHSGMLSN